MSIILVKLVSHAISAYSYGPDIVISVGRFEKKTVQFVDCSSQ